MWCRVMGRQLAVVWTWPTTVWTALQTISRSHIDCWRRAWVDLLTRRSSRHLTVTTVNTVVIRRPAGSTTIVPAVSQVRWLRRLERSTTSRAWSHAAAVWTSANNPVKFCMCTIAEFWHIIIIIIIIVVVVVVVVVVVAAAAAAAAAAVVSRLKALSVNWSHYPVDGWRPNLSGFNSHRLKSPSQCTYLSMQKSSSCYILPVINR